MNLVLKSVKNKTFLIQGLKPADVVKEVTYENLDIILERVAQAKNNRQRQPIYRSPKFPWLSFFTSHQLYLENIE